jgi:hypothetical protein
MPEAIHLESKVLTEAGETKVTESLKGFGRLIPIKGEPILEGDI